MANPAVINFCFGINIFLPSFCFDSNFIHGFKLRKEVLQFWCSFNFLAD
jgi:hypothetical protein